MLFHKPPGNDFEVFNDFNGNLVNPYRCVREQPEKLCGELRYLLNSRLDFEYMKQMLHSQAVLPDVRRAAYYYVLIRYSYAAGTSTFGSQPHAIQMAVGALYMFSVPRGYQDGFNQWMKQIAALCLTAFMQTSLLFLGLLTLPGNMLLGLGIMLAANEVPRIAQQFGLDSSVRVNMMSVVHATTTAVNLTRSVARAAGR